MSDTNWRNTYKTICVSVTAKKTERICNKLLLSHQSQKDGCLNQTIDRASLEPDDENLVITESRQGQSVRWPECSGDRICNKLLLSHPSQTDGCLYQTIDRASLEPDGENLDKTQTRQGQ